MLAKEGEGDQTLATAAKMKTPLQFAGGNNINSARSQDSLAIS